MSVIGIVGSRRRDSDNDFQIAKDAFFEVYKHGDTIVSGGCKKGGDRFAKKLSVYYNIPIKEHLPELPKNYDTLPGQFKCWAYAKAAYARNKLIARDADILIAIVAKDRTGGTENTIKWFKKLHKGTRRLIEK